MEFLEELRQSGKRILCRLVLDELASWPFKRFDIRLRRILATGLLFLFFETVELLGFLIIRQSIPSILTASLIVALVAALSIYVVTWCHKYTIEQVEVAASISTLGKNVEKRLVAWLRRVVNPLTQLLTSIVLTILVVLAVYILEHTVGVPFNINVSMFIAFGLSTFWMCQGGYWAVVTPLLTRELRQCSISEIGIYPISPSKTPILTASSRLYSAFAIWDAVMVTLYLIGLFALRPDFKSYGGFYLLFWVCIGYLVTFWTFLYPQFNLSQIVQRGKENTLFEIQREVNRLYEKLDKLEKLDFERLKHLMDLYETVRKSPSTVIGFSGLQSFIASLITPTFVAILGVLDWKKILEKFMSFFM